MLCWRPPAAVQGRSAQRHTHQQPRTEPMQQTLLSLVALLIVMLLNFSQMQASIRGQKQAVRAEFQQMALGVSMQTMEVIRARAYDAATIGLPTGEYAGTGDFESESNFGISGDCTLHPSGGGSDCSSISDFHGTQGSVPYALAGDSIHFEVAVEVFYLCETLERASETGTCSAPTHRKEVVIAAQDVPPSGDDPRLYEPIQYTEVIAYP